MKIRNNNILGLNNLIKLLGVIILVGACQNDGFYEVPQDDSPVLVEFSVATPGIADDSGSSVDADARITSIYILQFNADGESYGTLRYVAKGTGTTGGKYTATLLQSMGANDNYKLVILANLPDYGFLYGLYGKTYAQVQQACLSAETTVPLVFDDSCPFPMFGVVNGGASVQVQENTRYNGNTELIRAVARVDIGIGTKKTNSDGTISWTNTGSGKQPFVMTEVQVWKAGQKYTYMPAVGNYHWNTVTTGGITSNQIAIDRPSAASGGIATMTYGQTYITNGTYCLGRIYLPETDLQWGSVFDDNHTNRLAMIVGGYYKNAAALTYYRVDFTNDISGDKMNILRNHVYQFTITKIEDQGYATAELAYNSKPENMGFEVEIEGWDTSKTASVPSLIGYNISYGRANGENVQWTSSDKIPVKRDYWGGNQYKPFNYNEFYGEANSFYAERFPIGVQNGRLYSSVANAFSYEGAYPNLMVAGDDVTNTTGGDRIAWKTNGKLTAFDVCRNYREGGYNDWRLPRLSELALIYLNQESLKKMRGFTPLTEVYWSGSEYQVSTSDQDRKHSEQVWIIDFGNTSPNATNSVKSDTKKIRCVRQSD